MLKLIQAGTSLGTLSNHGTELAPMAILNGGLTDALAGNKIDFEILEPIADHEPTHELKQNLYNLDALVEFNQALYHQLVSEVSPRGRAVVLGGDHSIGIGSLFASKALWPEACVVYIDAHPDCSSPADSLSGYIHGMPLSTAMGDALYGRFEHRKYAYEDVFIIGVKDIDEAEYRYLTRHKIRYITMDEITERGIAAVTGEVVDKIGHRPVHVSLDIDSIDGQFAPGTGIVNHGGLNYREISYLTRRLAGLQVRAIDLVEVNPSRDIDGKTVDLGVELIMSLLGGNWSSYDKYMAARTDQHR